MTRCNQNSEIECDNEACKKCETCPAPLLCLCTRPEVIIGILRKQGNKNNTIDLDDVMG